MLEWPSRKEVACLSGTFLQWIGHLLEGGEGTAGFLGILLTCFLPSGLGLGAPGFICGSSPHSHLTWGWHRASRGAAQQTCVGNQMGASDIHQTDGAPALGQAWMPWTQRRIKQRNKEINIVGNRD